MNFKNRGIDPAFGVNSPFPPPPTPHPTLHTHIHSLPEHAWECCARRCEEEREYLRKQQAEVEHKLEVVCKTEADAKAEAKHAQLRYEDRDHELNERAALLRRQETELVRDSP